MERYIDTNKKDKPKFYDFCAEKQRFFSQSQTFFVRALFAVVE
jgi:hypothetical protein